jgi:hypothetical protein
MYRARRWFHQLPALTLIVLAFGATMHFSAVSSKGVTPSGPTLALQQPAAPVLDAAPAPQRTSGARPVAQLIPPPSGLQAVAFSLDDPASGQANSGGAYRAATGRYTINGHVVLLTTLYADADGASLGTRQLQLADGTTAWATPAAGPFAPNQIAFARDGLLITLSGDLPLDDLAALATRVTLRW